MLQSSGMLRIGSAELEYRMVGPLPHEALVEVSEIPLIAPL